MNKAFQYMFWGYFFIFFRIHIGLDWLADPIGYLLISSGCLLIIDQHPQAKKARIVAMIGAIISIPAIFINLSAPYLGMWEIYSFALSILKLIVAYFLFAVLRSVANDYGNRALIYRTKNVYSFYMTIHLSFLLFQSFSMNIPEDHWRVITIMLIMGALIIDITFLLLLGAIRRATTHVHDYSV